ncbi:MAG: glycosyltransferase family 4 protein [Candidatus Aenigmarchaeota archaeon]
MNILFTAYFPPNTGGAETSTHTLAKELERRGNKVVVASTGEYPGLKTYTFRKYSKIPSFRFHKYYLSRFLSGVIKKEKIDLVHSQDRLTTIGSITAAKRNRIPVVVHFRDYWFMCPKSNLLKTSYEQCTSCSYENLLKCSSKKRLPWDMHKMRSIRSSWGLLESADFKIAISNSVKEVLKSAGVTKNVKIIPNPINLDLFSVSHRDRIRKKYGLEGTVVTFVGSISYHKGTDTLKGIIPKISNGDVSFLIVGDGPEKKKLMNFVKERNLRNVVFTDGRIPYSQIPGIYSASDIILFPSRWQEPFGRIAIESMASGKPVVASDIGAIRDIVENGKTGFLIGSSDIAGWQRSVRKLVDDRGLRERMGRNGKEVARRKYDVRVIAGEVLRIYKNLTD